MDKTISNPVAPYAGKSDNEMHALYLSLTVSQETTKFLQEIAQSDPMMIRDYDTFSNLVQKMERGIKAEIRRYYEVER